MTYDTLMTQTLPTVVGMGVVSKATTTMFGKGKRTRKFGKRTYKAANWHLTKANANRDANFFRKRGHPARVERKYNGLMKKWGYAVYVA